MALLALMLVLLAGGMNGSFAVPMKYTHGWRWEHTWLVWAMLGMLVIPLVVAGFTVPHLWEIYLGAGIRPVELTALYGMIWGAGTILFGIGITRIGIALGFGITLGISCSVGTIVPLVLLHRQLLFKNGGLLTIAGVGVIFAGVLACARAGTLREAIAPERTHGSFLVGLGICVLSGIGSSAMSIALNEAEPISKLAEALGAPESTSLNSVWPVLLGGGFVVNAGYCAFLLLRNKSGVQFMYSTWPNLGLVAAMALLWSGSNFIYSAGARGLGSLGLVIGWPIFMAAIVLTANLWGGLTGEWRGTGKRPMAWAVVGCLMLVAGIWIIASIGGAS